MSKEEEKKASALSIGSTQPAQDGDQLKQQVLNNRQALLNNLSSNQPGKRSAQVPEDLASAVQPLEQGPSVASPEELSMLKVMELIFDTLEVNCLEANKALASTDAQLNCQKPQGLQDRIDKTSGESYQALRGHVSLPNYSLVVDGSDLRIAVFIAPSEFLLGFDPDSELLKPHLVLHRGIQSGLSGWYLGNTLIGAVMLPEITRQLLRNFISVARGQANPKQPFTYGAGGQANPQQSSIQGLSQFTSSSNVQRVSASDNSSFARPPGVAKPISTAETNSSNPLQDADLDNNYSKSLTRSQVVKQLMVEALDYKRSDPLPITGVSTLAPSNGGEGSGLRSLLAGSGFGDQGSISELHQEENLNRAAIKETNEFAMLSELISKEKQRAESQEAASDSSRSSNSVNPIGGLPLPPGQQRPADLADRNIPAISQPLISTAPAEDPPGIATPDDPGGNSPSPPTPPPTSGNHGSLPNPPGMAQAQPPQPPQPPQPSPASQSPFPNPPGMAQAQPPQQPQPSPASQSPFPNPPGMAQAQPPQGLPNPPSMPQAPPPQVQPVSNDDHFEIVPPINQADISGQNGEVSASPFSPSWQEESDGSATDLSSSKNDLSIEAASTARDIFTTTLQENEAPGFSALNFHDNLSNDEKSPQAGAGQVPEVEADPGHQWAPPSLESLVNSNQGSDVVDVTSELDSSIIPDKPFSRAFALPDLPAKEGVIPDSGVSSSEDQSNDLADKVEKTKVAAEQKGRSLAQLVKSVKVDSVADSVSPSPSVLGIQTTDQQSGSGQSLSTAIVEENFQSASDPLESTSSSLPQKPTGSQSSGSLKDLISSEKAPDWKQQDENRSSEDVKPTISGIKRPSHSLQSLLSSEPEELSNVEPPVSEKTLGDQSSDIGKVVVEAEKVLLEGCEQLLGNVNQALATLKEAGVEAMQGDDLEQVAEIMNHTKRLKALQDKLASLKSEFK